MREMIMKIKCKRCNKIIIVKNNSNEDVICPFCGTIHSWLYENGWGYYEKDFIKKKCPICKKYTYIKRNIFDSGDKFYKIVCDNCNDELLVKNKYNNPILFPYKQLLFDCKWCGEPLQSDIENLSREYLDKQGDTVAKYVEICKCPKCNNRTKVYLSPVLEDKHHTEKVAKLGRKKKIKIEEIENFIVNNILYNRYSILHPYNIIDFCENNHYDYESVFDYIYKKAIEIFIPLSLEEINELNVNLYEEEFGKLILKENAMKEAGGASLSKIIGQRKVWKDLRNLMIDKNNSTCKICGHKIENTRALHVHEKWMVEKNIVKLIDIELICSDCHACKHRNQFVSYQIMEGANPLVYGIPRLDFLTIHLMRVNNVSKEVIYAYRKKLLDNLNDFQMQRIIELSKNGSENKVEDEYRYIIGENIPMKKEIEAVLKEKELLL